MHIPIRVISLILSALAVVCGSLGMALSFLFLGSGIMQDITAGAAGFVAGAVLIGSGLISLAILASNEKDESWRNVKLDRFRDQSSTDISP